MDIDLFNDKIIDDKDKLNLIDLYKMYFETIEKNSDRRNLATNLYISINIALFWGFWYIINNEMNTIYLFILFFIWLIISIIFFFLINAYKQLNTWKFKVIHKLEEKLPLKLFKYEWKILGEWRNPCVYFPFSHIEILLPKILWFIYLFLIIFFVCRKFC